MSEIKTTNKAASDFQMKYVIIQDFVFKNYPGVTPLNAPVGVFSNGATSAVYSDQDKLWHGTVVVKVQTGDPESVAKNHSFYVLVSAYASFTLNADNTPDNKQLFTQLLRTNGAFSVFSSLRGMVAAATSAVGLSPGYIIPFWNLNNYRWEESPSE